MRPPSQNEEGKHDHLHSSVSRSAGNSSARLGEQGWQALCSTWLTRVLSQFTGQCSQCEGCNPAPPEERALSPLRTFVVLRSSSEHVCVSGVCPELGYI